jgi:hypothetical protein
MSTSSLLDAISAGWNEAWLPAPKRRPRELRAPRCKEQNGNTAGGLRWLAVPAMNRPPNEPSRLAGWTVEDHLDAPPVTFFLQETRFYPQPRSGFEAPRCLNGPPSMALAYGWEEPSTASKADVIDLFHELSRTHGSNSMIAL